MLCDESIVKKRVIIIYSEQMKVEIGSRKPIVAIGDVHGLDNWKSIVEMHQECKIVFLGDYLDPYVSVNRKKLIANLYDIINLKRSRPDDVILLLGNHDMHYFCEDIAMGTRFDYVISGEVSRMFIENNDLFQYAYQAGNRIFTHAGISQEWWDDDFHGDISKPIDEQLNHPSEAQMPALCRVGELRGGWHGALGGIFWADRRELVNPLHGFTQIVGHNRVADILEYKGEHDNKIVFCDCLWQGKYLHIEAEEQ